MKQQPFGKIAPFITVLLIYQLFLAFLVAVYGYEGSFLLLNGLHLDWLDAPMFLLTHLGDALILTSLLCLIFVRKNPGLVLLIILIVIITGSVGVLMKNFLFDSWERPLSVIGENGEVHTMFGYRLFRNSFPSGHSITVAAAITTIAMILQPKQSLMIMLALVIALISYTRIYAGVHFAGDVLAGTIIGVAGAMFLSVWLYPGIHRRVSGLSPAGIRNLRIFLLIAAIVGLIGGIVMIGEFLMQMI
jgi:membrane-associated phospholipid phosphatase